MKVRPGLILFAVWMALPGGIGAQVSDDPAEGPIPLDVMTFNIRTAAGRDGGNAWPYRKQLVARIIEQFSPQVVGLQEVLNEQIEFLESALPEYRWMGVDRGLNGGRGLSEATPIFYRYRELTPIESGTFWLSATPDTPTRGRRASRIVTWARFHHLESGQQVYVFNTHFSLRRGRRQLQAVEQINARVATLPPGSAVILMGDFNSVAETSDTWELATREGLRDAWVIAEERGGPAITANGFGPPPEGWEGRIDWILVSDPIAVRSIQTVVHSEDGRYPSDHYPVVSKLTLEREPPPPSRID